MRQRRAVAAAALLLAAGQSRAAPAPPRAISTVARQMSPGVARCLIRTQPDLVRRWLAALPDSTAEQRLFRSAESRFPACFDDDHLIGWGYQYDRPNMRAGLVRARLQPWRRRLPAAPPASAIVAWYAAAPVTREDAPAIIAADLGACLARARWDDTRALVDAVDPEFEKLEFVVVTRAENSRRREAAAADAALARLIPAIPACVPAGARLRLDRLRLRTLVEEAVWHIVEGLPPPVPAA